MYNKIKSVLKLYMHYVSINIKSMMQFSLAEMFARGFDAFSDMVRTGSFDQVLIRPRSEILQILGSKFELTRLGRMLQAVFMFIYGITLCNIQWDFTKIITVFLC